MSFRIPTALATLGLLLIAVSPASAQEMKMVKGQPTWDGRTLNEWIKDLSAPAPYTRHSAAYAIAEFGPKGAPAVPALIKNLEDDQPTVRYSSALALGDIGPTAKDAVEPLKKLLDDRNEDVAAIARKSLKKITGETIE